ncbi:hypothetical protein HJ588_04035 [Flexivirga sp. ID2601S]|uniref:Uncharacterized protein n=1 Tax=Flexivirga aerilata TaxID=1656889 RepID=A0A849AC23_9MICO|nr:hypothetical protein [Flexivirga aerilata]NNG38444.1 hypothetical protein [Flexivirga aerilata]
MEKQSGLRLGRPAVIHVPLAERWDHDLCLHLVHEISGLLDQQAVDAKLEEGHLQIRGLHLSQLVAGLDLLARLARRRADHLINTAPTAPSGHVRLPAGAWAHWGAEQRTIGQATALRAVVTSMLHSDAPLP